MSNKSGASEQIISLPSGGGAQSGLGEKFTPDLYTGTGNFTVPFDLPEGRNDFDPDLDLVYSTGNPNSYFGLGWTLDVPGIARKTSNGVPRYQGNDTFILAGVEDLVLVAVNGNRRRYQPRTEGLFAIIERVFDANNDYWEVKSTDGQISLYGTPNAKGADPAALFDPADPDNVSAWKLTENRDVFGNRIVYDYARDLQQTVNRHWNQLYVSAVRYVDYKDAGDNDQFLLHVEFHYEDRPDPFSQYRTGYEIRTTRRCTHITVSTHTETDVLQSKSFVFTYEQSPLNGASLLKDITIVGHDGAAQEALPGIALKYSEFDLAQRDFFPLKGRDLPTRSLGSPEMELVDLFGNGLPDVIEMIDTIRYWRNLGNGEFAASREMQHSPGGLNLGDPGVQLLDANGEGKADLVVSREDVSGYYPLSFQGHWERGSFRKYTVTPSFRLDDPEVRLFDLSGDGVTDALRTGNRFECFFSGSR